MEVAEGSVRIEVPTETDGAAEAVGDGVFYNPTQRLNRDITVAVLRAYGEREPRASSYLDGMTASGIRAIRAARAGYAVTAVDTDPAATALAAANARRNDVAVDVRTADVNTVLHAGVFDVTDIDPFGSPIGHLDAAVVGTRNLLCVTATDTAPLCGAHQAAGIRRYAAVPQNTTYHREMGLRILVGAIVRTAARYDVAAVPILAHATRHYVRVYTELERSASAADEAVAALGWVEHCPECLFRTHAHGMVPAGHTRCPHCDSDQLLTAGPLHLERTTDPSFAAAVTAAVDPADATAAEAEQLLGQLAAELPRPTHYDQHRLCHRWTRSAPRMDPFLEALATAGFAVSRTHYGGTTFKTDADVAEIEAVTAGV